MRRNVHLQVRGAFPPDFAFSSTSMTAIIVDLSIPTARARVDWVRPGFAAIRAITPNCPGDI
jgi:hypothetical protein